MLKWTSGKWHVRVLNGFNWLRLFNEGIL
jgi:hypothetical protein